MSRTRIFKSRLLSFSIHHFSIHLLAIAMFKVNNSVAAAIIDDILTRSYHSYNLAQNLRKRYVGNESTSKTTSTMVDTGKEYHTTWYFGLSRSPGNNLLRHFESKYDEYCTFLCECFLFCIKVSSP